MIQCDVVFKISHDLKVISQSIYPDQEKKWEIHFKIIANGFFFFAYYFIVHWMYWTALFWIPDLIYRLFVHIRTRILSVNFFSPLFLLFSRKPIFFKKKNSRNKSNSWQIQ